MVEHLPSSSPWHRERQGPFTESDLLTREVESRLRDLLVVEHAQLGALRAGLRLQGGDNLPTPRYIPVPGPEQEVDEEQLKRHAAERSQLSALMHRN